MVGGPEVVTGPSPAAARAAVAVVAGLFGLFIGSFLNVVVYRVPRGLSIVRPASFCPACGTPVRPTDNVPVLGWLALGGKCRSCRSPISARYPLVEALTGGLFALIGALVGPHLAVPAMCALAATFVALVAIELDRQPSPPGVSLIGGGLGLALFVVPSARSGYWGPLAGAAAALAVTGGAWARTRAASPEPRRRVLGALCTLVPLGVLLGWVGAGSIAAVTAGALSAAAVTVGAGTWRAGDDRGAGRFVARLPLAVAVGAAVGFGVAAVFGALAGA
jgi:leader peptidase (prepilin peptidase)/N-methyltransferase